MLGCGKKDFPDYSDKDDIVFYEEENAVYDVEFIYLNRRLAGKMNLISTVWVRDIQFYVKIIMNNGPSRVRFQQYIHRGFRCPDAADDTNKDGILDLAEVKEASGEMLIPLDGFIQEHMRGNEWFPSSSKAGSYYYSRSASVTKLMTDLYMEVDGGQSRLQKGEGLNLERRTMIIYGSKNNPLLPVACGIFKKKYL